MQTTGDTVTQTEMRLMTAAASMVRKRPRCCCVTRGPGGEEKKRQEHGWPILLMPSRHLVQPTGVEMMTMAASVHHAKRNETKQKVESFEVCWKSGGSKVLRDLGRGWRPIGRLEALALSRISASRRLGMPRVAGCPTNVFGPAQEIGEGPCFSISLTPSFHAR